MNPDPFNPKQLTEVRQCLDMTQADFAEAIGYTPAHGAQQIRELEHGMKNRKAHRMTGPATLSLRRMLAIARAYVLLHNGHIQEAMVILEEELPPKLRSKS